MTEASRGTVDLLKIAVPMVVSRAGLATMGIADAVMVGHFNPSQFAFLSLADGTLGRVLDLCAAFLLGGLILVPRAFGAGDLEGCRRAWRRTLTPSLLLGLFGLGLGFAAGPLLRLLGQPPALAAHAAPVAAVLGAGFAAALLGICAAVYLEGIQRPVVVAVAVVSGNVLNIFCNWLLIGGHLGLPALGAVGSALSTTAVRVMLALLLVGYAWSVPAVSGAQASGAAAPSDDQDSRQQWRLGSSAFLIQGTMLGLVVCLTLFAGRLGPLELAAFGSVWVLNAPVALIALGLADATGIQVAKADGSRVPGAPRQTGRNGLRITLLLQLPLLALWLLLPRSLAGLITQDPAFQTRLAALIPLAGCVMAADGLSFVAVAAIRALRDITWSSIIEVGTMALMVALAAYLAFGAGLGVRGLILAAALTAALRCLLLIGRFGNLTRPALASR